MFPLTDFQATVAFNWSHKFQFPRLPLFMIQFCFVLRSYSLHQQANIDKTETNGYKQINKEQFKNKETSLHFHIAAVNPISEPSGIVF